MAVIMGDDWTTVPAETDERPMPPSRDRSYPPRHSVDDDDGRLPDRLNHWEGVVGW